MGKLSPILLSPVYGEKHMTLPKLYLRRREERRIVAGHPWVFSNEVATERSPLGAFEPGQFVNVYAHGGKPLGTAYVNPHSLICARLVSRRTDRPLDAPRLRARLETARALRERLGWLPCCRLVFSESDFLPGLVADGYGDVLVVQLGTAGMEALREPVLEALEALYRPGALVLRNDLESRRLEGLECGVELASGRIDEPVYAEENGARFVVSPLEGQKTGWYYDHRANRARLAPYVGGRDVLDCFSYTGAWGVQSALAGARSVLCVDTSQGALDTAARNAELNGVGERVATRRGDVFETLKALDDEGRRFDVVVLDPPAFIRRRKDVAKGTEGYRRLNRLAMRVLADDGLLVSASCSFHLRADQHAALVAGAGRALGRRLQILDQGHQAADHPVQRGLG